MSFKGTGVFPIEPEPGTINIFFPAPSPLPFRACDYFVFGTRGLSGPGNNCVGPSGLLSTCAFNCIGQRRRSSGFGKPVKCATNDTEPRLIGTKAGPEGRHSSCRRREPPVLAKPGIPGPKGRHNWAAFGPERGGLKGQAGLKDLFRPFRACDYFVFDTQAGAARLSPLRSARADLYLSQSGRRQYSIKAFSGSPICKQEGSRCCSRPSLFAKIRGLSKDHNALVGCPPCPSWP